MTKRRVELLEVMMLAIPTAGKHPNLTTACDHHSGPQSQSGHMHTPKSP